MIAQLNEISNDDLNKITKQKNKAEKIKIYEKFAFDDRKMSAVKNCGSYLLFDNYINIADKKTLLKLLHFANFCNVTKFCPMCAYRKSQKVALELISKISTLRKQLSALKNPPQLRFVYLTLTVKNPKIEDLKLTINNMTYALKKLTLSKRFVDAVPYGYFRSIEYMGDNTVNNYAHPHYHILLCVNQQYFAKKYISREEWALMWQKALGVDYFPDVYVSIVKPSKKIDSGITAACYEVAKYSVTPAILKKIDNNNFEQLYHQTKHCRQYGYGGLIKTLEPDLDELDPADWEYLQSELYKYFVAEKSYKQTTAFQTDEHILNN